MLGPTDPAFVSESEKRGGGLLLRRGTKVQLWNSLLQKAATHCINIDDTDKTDTYKHVMNANNPGTDLVVRNTILDCEVAKTFAVE